MTSAGTGTLLHRIWKNMVARCHTPTNKAYQWYGARGITVAPEWRNFVGFLDWALDADYRRGLTLDRIDSDGIYDPDNCRWISRSLNSARQHLPRNGEYVAGLDGRLTDDIIRDAGSRGRAFKLTDGKNLFLWVSPTGHRSWRFAFRYDGKHQLLVIGPYPETSIEEARERCMIARMRLSEGRNPVVMKREAAARRSRR